MPDSVPGPGGSGRAAGLQGCRAVHQARLFRVHLPREQRPAPGGGIGVGGRVRRGDQGASCNRGEAASARGVGGGGGLPWPPSGLGTCRLPASPSVPCFCFRFVLPPLFGWDEITVFVLRGCPARRGSYKMESCVSTGGDYLMVVVGCLTCHPSSVSSAILVFWGRPRIAGFLEVIFRKKGREGGRKVCVLQVRTGIRGERTRTI